MGNLEDLRDRHTSDGVTCIVKHCRVRRCSLGLGATRSVCIACDRCDAFSTEARRPDLIVLSEETRGGPHTWLVVEVKGGFDDPSLIAGQLQAGATSIEQHALFRLVSSPSHHLVPLVLFDGRSHAADFAALGRKRVRFYSKQYPIRALRCRSGLRVNDVVR